MAEAAADLHGRVPLPVLAGEELVVPFEGVPLVTEVLDDGLLGQAMAGCGVTPVSPVLRLRWGRTHYGGHTGGGPVRTMEATGCWLNTE